MRQLRKMIPQHLKQPDTKPSTKSNKLNIVGRTVLQKLHQKKKIWDNKSQVS